MGEEVPGISVFAVILAHRAPLALAEIGAKLLPGSFVLPGFVEAGLFSRHGGVAPPLLVPSRSGCSMLRFTRARSFAAPNNAHLGQQGRSDPAARRTSIG